MVEVLRLALLCYREPRRCQRLQQVELPEGIDILLRVAAGGSTELVEEFGRSVGTSRDELRKAAEFFIQQVLFVRSASHYRVLGLTTTATSEQIRVHHRLLMRLLHPDHKQVIEEWADSYARRVNEAYSILRKPWSRCAYDLSIAGAPDDDCLASQAVSIKPFQLSVGRYRRGDWRTRFPPLLTDNLPALALGGLALLAGLFVLGVYLFSQRDAWQREVSSQGGISLGVTTERDKHELVVVATQSKAWSKAWDELFTVRSIMLPETVNQPPTGGDGDYGGRHEGVEQKTAVITPDDTARKSHDRGQADGDNLEQEGLVSAEWQSAEPGLAQEPPEKKMLQKEIVQMVSKVAESGSLREKKEKEKIALGQMLSQRKREDRSFPSRTKECRSLQPRSEEQWVAISEPQLLCSSLICSEQISEQELEALIKRFIIVYERGDLEGLMALFAVDADANRNQNRNAIHRDYQDLFYATNARLMNMTDLRWNRQGNYASGDGLFKVSVRERNQQDFNNYQGTIYFEVQKTNGKVLITNLSNKTD